MTDGNHVDEDVDVALRLGGLVRNAIASSGGIAAGRDVHVSIKVELVMRCPRDPTLRDA